MVDARHELEEHVCSLPGHTERLELGTTPNDAPGAFANLQGVQNSAGVGLLRLEPVPVGDRSVGLRRREPAMFSRLPAGAADTDRVGTSL